MALAELDKEYGWPQMGGVIIRHRQCKRYTKRPETNLDDHTTWHEDAFEKMAELVFGKRVCDCGRPIEPYPEEIRKYEMVDPR